MAEQVYNPASGVAPQVGQWLHGSRKGMIRGSGKTGWVWDGSTWVQMKNGAPTGQTQRNPENTNLLGKTTNSLKNLFLGGSKNRLKINTTKNLSGKYQQGLTLDEHKANILNRLDTGREQLNKQEQNAWYSPFLPENNQTTRKSKTSKKINLGNYKKEGYQHYIDSDGLDAFRKIPNKTKLKMTKAEKKWLKENPSGTFINSDGLDEAYSPEFDLIRARQAVEHKKWLINNNRV